MRLFGKCAQILLGLMESSGKIKSSVLNERNFFKTKKIQNQIKTEYQINHFIYNFIKHLQKCT